MDRENKKNLWLCFIHENRWHICFCFLCLVLFFTIFYLYRLPLESVLYATGLCLFLGFIFSIARFAAYHKKIKQLDALQYSITVDLKDLPKPRSCTEELYQELMLVQQADKLTEISEAEKKLTDITDYFTLWAHQIKTPIAAMDLVIQNNYDDIQSESHHNWQEMDSELFKIQQYVDMVLQYLRLNSTMNDFVLKEYDLDSIIRQALRKYASMFIRKKIKLVYEPVNTKVTTDEKWLLFVIEQLLSNAVKYTKSGCVTIYMEETGTKVLIIEDTGMGILEEDLPRVFDRGYTGYNGRKDKKATGIGLYLCRQILNKLSHKITMESETKVGTKVKLDLSNL